MAQRRNKRPQDEDTLVDIVEAKENATDFFESNQNLILGGAILLLLVIGGIFAYKNFYQAPRNQEAMEQMAQAQQMFERDSFAQALENPGGGFYGFLEIIDRYSGTKAANLANYYAGISWLNLGEFDAAISYLEDFDEDGYVLPITKSGAIGDAYAEKGELDKALSWYESAANEGDNEFLSAYYLKKYGMLSEKQGQYDDARDAYERIQEDYPDSPDARDIEKYIARVARK